jgi:hypothetical protein
MPDTISEDTPKRGKRAINLEEWADIMTRLYRIINLELTSIEKDLNNEKNADASKIKPAEADRGTRRFMTAVRAVQHVHAVNKDVAAGEDAEKVKEALHESDEARAELDRKLQRIIDARRAQSAAGGDQQ